MIQTIESNLLKAVYLLENISEEQYQNISIKPYHSSIGGHIRHIMDVFNCVFNGLESREIDLTARNRNRETEQVLSLGRNYIFDTISKIKEIAKNDLSCMVYVTDDLGTGKIRVEYTLSAILIQSHSHAIHHYASIGYIIYQLGIDLPDDTFGFNPTTPKKVAVSF